MLEEARNSDSTAQPSARGARASSWKAAVVRQRKRLLEDRQKLAAIVGDADRCLIRHRLCLDEIAPSQLEAIDPGDACCSIDQSFDQVVGLRPARPAIGAGLHGVGVHAADIALNARYAIDTR